MPIWPFNLSRRRKSTIMSADSPALAERSQNLQGAVAQPARPTSSSRKRRASQQKLGDDDGNDAEHNERAIAPVDKENLHAHASHDEITALPIKWRLDHSPHLRPVDADREKAAIPYDFQASGSHTSVPHTNVATPSKAGTLRSKRSTFDGSNSVKRRSSKKRKDEHLREEEIRAMSTTSSPQPKRTGDGVLRKESMQRRSLIGKKASVVSLPPADPTTISTPPTIVEQNGWEIREFWFNPRPPIRLSKVPAYTYHSPSTAQLPLARNISQKVKDKMPKREEHSRRQRTIGATADGLDSSDLRLVLERDAKRRQDRERRKQERLDRKLRAAGRTRSSSEISRLDDVEKDKAVEAATATAVATSQRTQQPQSQVHPAFRSEAISDTKTATNAVENPFASPDDAATGSGGYVTPRENEEGPFEDPVVETAREVRLSIATTPPLSPVDRSRRASSRIPPEPLSPALISPPQSPTPAETTPAVPIAAAAAATVASKPSSLSVGSQSRDRRSGAWASFFKRGGTQREAKSPEMSFANTSRESMGRQQLPAHLLGERESPFPKRTKSGPPTRTQSKFREDLPDAPISPPDSRIQSPVSEMPYNAAAIAAAAAASSHAQPASPTVMQERAATHAALSAAPGRSDTPVSPTRSPDVMDASLASVDSEASWLASGGSLKRGSAQSGLRRSVGSSRRYTPDPNASYEDVSGTHDKDADYVRTGGGRQAHRAGDSAVAGASREDDVDTALPVHGSVRRKATLIHHDPAVRSREGLLSEYSAGSPAKSPGVQDDSTDDSDFADGGPQLQKALSIDYGKGHARQVSAGSAKLLDVTSPKRHSVQIYQDTQLVYNATLLSAYPGRMSASIAFRRTLLTNTRNSLRTSSLPKQHLYKPAFKPRFFTATMSDQGVHNLKGMEQYNAEVVNEKDSIVVLDCYATWCGPCKVIAPKIVEFSHKYPDIKFYKLDVDESPDVAQTLGVRAMPTFYVFKNGEKVADVVGANPVALEQAFTKFI